MMTSRTPTGQAGTRPMLLPEDKPLLLVMDGHAIVHRAWNAIRDRQHLSIRRTGEDTTAVFGFTNTFLRVLKDWEPTHCAIAFDLPTPTFRHLMFAQYKAQRPETPPELRAQFDRVKQIMRAFDVPIYELEGYEADDVIGTLCRQAEESSIETVILTGDSDAFQLVSPWVRVDFHSGFQDRKVYGEAEIRARYGGLVPAQQPDLKALKGDTSDNIPGVPGVGDKTAVKLLVEHHDLEGIYAHADEIVPPRLREALIANRELAFQGRELTTIVRDAPVELDLEACRFWRYDRQRVVELFSELEFSSAVSRIPEPMSDTGTTPGAAGGAVVETPESVDYRLVADQSGLEAMAAELSAAGDFAFDTETTSKDPMKADLVGLSFSATPGKAWYVPVGHLDGPQLAMEEVLAQLKPLLESPEVKRTAHNANFDLTVLANHGIRPGPLHFDTMVAAHLLGRKAQALGLKGLALEQLNVEMTPIKDLIGTGAKQITMAQVPAVQAGDYACADADMTGRLRLALEEEVRREGLWDLISGVEMALVPVLVTVQRNGVAVDAGLLHEMSRDLNVQLRQLETTIYDQVGHVVNLNSPQQLSDLLFNELQLPKSKRTKTGYSTDANSLEELKGQHPVIDGILEYRQLSKLKSTYLDALPQLVNPRTGRLHTSYNQTGSATGRVSSSDPNLQNIPVRTELGRQVRKSFLAQGAPEWVFLSADYSQIELRVLAHLSRDPALMKAFENGEDIHSSTASLMYDVPIDGVTSDMRRIAKVLNFGVIYGLSAFGISQQTEFSPEDGQRFIETYFSNYSGIQQYLDSVKQQAREQGYVSTVLGRRRLTPDVNVSNYNVRQAAERAAVNMPIQGTAADIMKLAMIRLHRRMEAEGLRSKMLLQVHDELVFEVPRDELDAVKKMVLEEMPAAMDMAVPLVVDLKVGPTWGDLE